MSARCHQCPACGAVAATLPLDASGLQLVTVSKELSPPAEPAPGPADAYIARALIDAAVRLRLLPGVVADPAPDARDRLYTWQELRAEVVAANVALTAQLTELEGKLAMLVTDASNDVISQLRGWTDLERARLAAALDDKHTAAAGLVADLLAAIERLHAENAAYDERQGRVHEELLVALHRVGATATTLQTHLATLAIGVA